MKDLNIKCDFYYFYSKGCGNWENDMIRGRPCDIGGGGAGGNFLSQTMFLCALHACANLPFNVALSI